MVTTMYGRIAVLGATGYLGTHISQMLHAAGFPVHGHCRRPQHAAGGPPTQATDARHLNTVIEALAGFETVINCTNAPLRDTCKIAHNLALWQAKSKFRHVIHISSFSVYGQDHGLLTEQTDPVPSRLHPYALGKLMSERILLKNVTAHGSCAVIRIGFVYGRAAPQWINGISRLLRSGRLNPSHAHVHATCDLIHAIDVANAIKNLLSARRAIHGIVNLTHPERITWPVYLGKIMDRLDYVSTPSSPTWLKPTERRSSSQVFGQYFVQALRGPIPIHLYRTLKNCRRIGSIRQTTMMPTEFIPIEAGLDDAMHMHEWRHVVCNTAQYGS